jgi:ABC-type multidrug transport system fused ATPase/permease subunit
VHGRVEESGTHEQLMASNTYYRRLVEKQEGIEAKEQARESIGPPSGCLLANDNLECRLLPVPVNNAPHVEFNNVSFSYPSRPKKTVLQGFSLTLHHGETVAIVGE